MTAVLTGQERNLVRAGLLAGFAVASGGAWLAPLPLLASSHREAPLISQDPFADNTDVYAFVSPNDPSRIVLIANWIPFEAPEGGPNYYEWDSDALYEIHIDNDGDAVPDVTYSLTSRIEDLDPDTFLYSTGPITSITDPTWNRRQRVTLSEVVAGGATTILVDDELTAPVHIGDKSTPDHPALVQQAVRTFTDPGNGDAINVFAGATDDAFFVDLQVFDLLTLRGQPPPVGYPTGSNTAVDSLSGFNVHSLVIELPVDRLVGANPVLGVWATTSRAPFGTPQQVSRLGSPLVNEVLLPLAHKDAFNGFPPSVDPSVYSLLQESFEDPELGTLLCTLYGIALPGDGNDDCHTELTPGTPRSGRGDIHDIFQQGMVLANPLTIETGGGTSVLPVGFNINRPAGVVPAEMLRINTGIAASTLCKPVPSRLGLLGGDVCGFPNGRRLGDDVTDIELLAVAGAAYQALDGRDGSFTFDAGLLDTLTDGVDANDVPFLSSFPYLACAQSGQQHVHQNP